MLAGIFIDPHISVEGDLKSTIQNIFANQLLFNLSNAINLLMFIGVAILSLAIYEILRPVNKPLATLGLVWRLMESILGVVGVLANLLAFQLLKSENSSTIFGGEQLEAMVGFLLDSYWTVTIIVFVFLALGSSVSFYLFYRTEYIPKTLSI